MNEEMDLSHAHAWRLKKEAKKFGFLVLTLLGSTMAGWGYVAAFCP